MNYVLGRNRSQVQMECLDDFVDSDSEVRVIDRIVDTLDVEKLGFALGDNDEVGRPKFDPRDMLKLFVYGYFNGIRSSRKLAKQTKINREIIWLSNFSRLLAPEKNPPGDMNKLLTQFVLLMVIFKYSSCKNKVKQDNIY
jgi:transposase